MATEYVPALSGQFGIPAERIERKIYFIRGQKVMLDADLADLYEVPTKAFNQAVRRNKARFPGDFMFELSREEAAGLRSQSVTIESGEDGRGRHSKYATSVFTEQGVSMLSAVLRSDRAIEVSIAIVRVFVRLREILATHKDLAAKINLLESKFEQQDEKLNVVFDAIRALLAEPTPPEFVPLEKRRIGFRAAAGTVRID